MMATVTPEIPDKVNEAKAKAAAANSIPQLKLAVEELADAVTEVKIRLDKLEKKVGR